MRRIRHRLPRPLLDEPKDEQKRHRLNWQTPVLLNTALGLYKPSRLVGA